VESLEPRGPVARLAGAGLYVAAIAVVVLLQELGLRLRREEQRAWWPATGRDALNAAGFAALAAALVLFGYPLPAALVAGGNLTLALFATSIGLEARAVRSRRTVGLLLAAALGLPLLAFPRPVLRAIAGLVERLFPGG
jgi:hypothetical protein